MIKKLWRYIIFYYFYFHFIVWKFVKNYLEKPREPTELDKYIEKNKNKLLNSFEEYFTKDMNENIDKVFYDKTTFKELLDNFEKDDTIEKQWKTRLLYENVSREDGIRIDIIMYYDVFKQGFAYYSNENFVSYKILNAIAMNYVMKFFCRDFFMDENVLEDINKELDLKEVFLKYDEKKKEKNEKKKRNNNVLAKLKNYQMEDKRKKPNEENKEQKKELMQNKFINKGKMYNFDFLVKEKKPSAFSTSYDKGFVNISYKDYKNMF